MVTNTRLGMLAAGLCLATACSSREPVVSTPSGDVPAPWSGARLPRASVPAVYVTAWNEAENRSSCALVAFADSEATLGAVARRATFSGGWGVAYDRPELRSAFGIAGAGVRAADPTYDEWPFKRNWSDSSRVGYGPEGGSGPNQLAYLRITGQDCLYNVWSRVGRAHLEQLLEAIRFVQRVGPDDPSEGDDPR